MIMEEEIKMIKGIPAKEYHRLYRLRNKERIAQLQRSHYSDNKDYINSYRRSRYRRKIADGTWNEPVLTEEQKDRKNAKQRSRNKTFVGFLAGTYSGMRSRTRSKRKRDAAYFGLPILTRQEFIEWASSDSTYKQLYTEWVSKDYDYLSTPSIDRIDSFQGYTLDNIQWIKLHDNMKRSRR